MVERSVPLQSKLKFSRRTLVKSAASAALSLSCIPTSALETAEDRDSKLFLDHAGILAETLQKRWFHSDPYAQWGNDQNAWNTCNTLEALIDYTKITGDKSYLKIIRQTSTDQVLIKKVMRDGVDDEAWAGIALAKAYRLTRDKSCLEVAKTIFASMTTYWDDACNGGVWWNFKRTYKNAITNELFLVLALLLHKETKSQFYLDWAKKEWDWFEKSGMINSESLVNDGLHECKNNNGETWTYNQGVILGGLTDLHRVTHDKAYLNQALKIALASINALAKPRNGIPVLQEVGGDLNADQQQFKGIFVRYLAILAHALPKEAASDKKTIRDFICINADSLWKNARNEENQINAYWHETERKPIYSPITLTSGLDLLNAAVSLHKP